MRTPLIAGNWKMFKTVARDGPSYAKELRALVEGRGAASRSWSRRRSRRCTPRPRPRATGNVAVAAQDLHWEREGAFTGEVSAAMLREAGAALRRSSATRSGGALFGETDDDGEPEGARRARRGPRPDRLRRRDARGARRATRRWPCSTARSRTGLDGVTGDQVAEHGDRLRAGVGHRHRPHRHARSRPARRTRTSASACGSGSASTPRSTAASSTAAASSPTTSPS